MEGDLSIVEARQGREKQRYNDGGARLVQCLFSKRTLEFSAHIFQFRSQAVLLFVRYNPRLGRVLWYSVQKCIFREMMSANV